MYSSDATAEGEYLQYPLVRGQKLDLKDKYLTFCRSQMQIQKNISSADADTKNISSTDADTKLVALLLK